MTVLMWDQPKKKLTTIEWRESAGFEDGPAGGYVPNMSDEDAQRWKAKLTGKRIGFPQIEIRKTVRGASLLIIVNMGKGYNYKYYRADGKKGSLATSGVNVHLSVNGPLQMTFAEMAEMNAAVEEAKAYLEAMADV